MKAAFILLAVVLMIGGAVAFNAVKTQAETVSTDARSGDAERGAAIFHDGVNGAPACVTCHITEGFPLGFSVAPSLDGVGERAAERIADMNAAVYLQQSIVDPAAFVAPGFRPIMFSDYAAHLSEQDIADLIAYLLTL